MTRKTVIIDSRLCAPQRLPLLDAGRAVLHNSSVAIDIFFCCISPSSSELHSHADQGEMAGELLALTTTKLHNAKFMRALCEPSNSSGEARHVLTKEGISLGMVMDSFGRTGIAVRLENAVLDLRFYERSYYAFLYVSTCICIAYIDIVQQLMQSDLLYLEELCRLLSCRLRAHASTSISYASGRRRCCTYCASSWTWNRT